MHHYLDFEKPISDLEGKIHELKKIASEDESIDTSEEVERLEARAREAMAEIYAKLTPWQKTQVARHPQRPHFVDYASRLFSEWTPLAGDRKFAEDAAIQAGLARFNGQPVALIGQEKGNDTKSRIQHNFGSARPEGYRKAIRVMEMAERFGLPIVTLIDTAGAYPGIGAEERGQAEAIARSTEMCLNVTVPIVSVIIGEGGSGGAIAIATGDRVYMLQHSIYSVISPEGAASILWRDSARAKEAATTMKITAEDLKGFGIVDGIIEEPVGGAHRDHEAVINRTGETIAAALADLLPVERATLRKNRREKYLAIGRSL
ncbi:acetyl-CoA carboxylase carboxyltransferase subunit alpha [Xaviernesmea oryzae]|uniref:Acetyl-coenzyme A carboxylase carboxyl transferase subunit alpha n=1 Tax=Xaviernesmea oryzae TaxID=464029 RepID=A0A1Q9B260_9HYPH|nr:acetyl-CoA carboxylase carboxyltransferase subunit alpha [Xaviernesmea oryzae]OLP62105.1 acetyl-CoA carboxylase carboxyltransferase subunit alpha [Xaviernesmea oryzae]SEL87590.1 acetyl-CoA carboxylase carboxyltransferase subunit alpha [Xaviernesmea oryzae]